MTQPYKKKLIEVAIPLEAINAASAREKSIRHGHPSTLHLWWARRPLAACRAVLFAQLVDDPSGYADKLLNVTKIRKQAEADLVLRLKVWRNRKSDAQGNLPEAPEPTLEDCAADIERKRLFQIIKELVIWENSTNEEVLERARVEIRRSCGDKLPPVYDPFSGGGSIPLEAQRLGLPAYGSDLNPVAVMIGKAMIEIPPKFKDMSPIHPGPKERQFYRNAEGLAEDVKYYGEWMREKARARIGHLYPQVDLPKKYGGGKANVIAWFWARTVTCANPGCRCETPLLSSFVLSSKKGNEAYLTPVIEGRAIRFEVGDTFQLKGRNPEEGYKRGKSAVFECAFCGTPTDRDYVAAEGLAGRIGAIQTAVACEGKRSRIYFSADYAPLPQDIPDVDLPALDFEFQPNPRDVWCRNFGLIRPRDLFTKRQLATLSVFQGLVLSARAEVERASQLSTLPDDNVGLNENGHGAKAYGEAVSVYLTFALDRAADAWSSSVTWRSSVQASRSTFARQALPMTWDYVELNPFSDSNGNWTDASVEWVYEALGAFVPASQGEIRQGDAQTVEYPGLSVISSDPPYYDNIGYADLADFFFAWMKPALKSVYPSLFGILATPKAEELVAAPYRQGGALAAEEFFLNGMKDAIRNMQKNTHPAFPAAIYYAFKQSEVEAEGISSTGWATFIQAVVEAGYAVVGTWPMRTEKPGRMVSLGTNALANSVVLVCRKKEAAAKVITRAEFIRALKRELPPAIAELQAANIAPADMPQSAIGPGMGVFSRYKAVLESDDSPMSVKTALQLINRELDEYLGGIQGEFDADTRFAITWFEQNGLKAGDYGTANNIATARGISVESVKHAGIVESQAGKVRVLRRDELNDQWEPGTDQHLTIWECLQYLVRMHEKDGISLATAVLLKKIGDKAEAVKDLAYILYDISANKRQDAKEATAYNALIADWTELSRQAAAIYDTRPDGQQRFDL